MSSRDAADRSRLRVSDAEREKAAGDLGNALSEGRLSVDEHSERLDAVYAAKTYGDLQRILDDLPAGQPALPVQEPTTLAASSGSESGERWRLRPVDLAATVDRPVPGARAAIIDRRAAVARLRPGPASDGQRGAVPTEIHLSCARVAGPPTERRAGYVHVRAARLGHRGASDGPAPRPGHAELTAMLGGS